MEKNSKVPMSERRPLYYPENINDSNYQLRMSYFSETVAREQNTKARLISKIYRPSLGYYKFSKASEIFTEYIRGGANAVICCQFSPLKKFLTIGYDNGTIQVMPLSSEASEVVKLTSSPKRVTTIRYPKSGSSKGIYASCLNGKVYIIQLSGSMASIALELQWNSQVLFQEPCNEINAMDVGDADNILTAGKDATIRQYDVNSGKLIGTFSKHDTYELTSSTQTKRHVKRICALKYVNRENIFVTGGWDNSIKVWDIRCPDPVRDIFGYHINGSSIDVMDKSILIGHWAYKNGLHLVDLGSSKVIKYIRPTNRPILYSGEFISNVKFMQNLPSVSGTSLNGDVILVAGSGTCAMEIISINENTVLHSSQEINSVMGLDTADNLIAYGGYNETFSMLSFSPSFKKSFMLEKMSTSSTTPLSVSIKSLVPSSVDIAWKKMWEEFEKPLENQLTPSKLQPSEEERFMELFLEEVKAQSGTGPKSLIGEKLTQYANQIEMKPNFSDTIQLDNNDSNDSLEKLQYNSYDLLPQYTEHRFNSENKLCNK